jgi:putative membrane protein
MRLARAVARPVVAATLLLGLAGAAFAHSPLAGGDLEEQLAALLAAAVLAGFWGIYLLGAWRKPPGWPELAAFHAGMVLAASALLGPLDEWAETSAAMHMTQHMLLIVVIAPLWVLSRPLPQVIAGGGRPVAFLWRPMLKLAGRPLWAAYLHGAVIWFWHLPVFYMLALEDPWWHVFEHACFLVTAGIFWWAILRSGQNGAPWALLALLLTLMHTGFLGAALTFARVPLYGEARDLQDQQLAGLIMWVLAGIPYLLASTWIGHRWFRQLEAGAGQARGEA